MLNELYTFAEPVQVVPFSNLKWGKFTLLHTAARCRGSHTRAFSRQGPQRFIPLRALSFLYNHTIKNPENVKIRLKIGRIM